MTSFTDFYPTLRAILGDRQVMGLWNYGDADLLSALRSVFALGRGPAGYALDAAALNQATGVDPAVELGDPFALIAYDACLILVGGEDGAMSIRTRSLSISDSGHRKRDLLWELRGLVSDIRGGGAYFSTRQSIAQWIGSFPVEDSVVPYLALGSMEVRSGVVDLTL